MTVVNTPGAWSERARSASNSWDAAMWSYQGQQDRFEAVLDELYDLQDGDSLLDFGCGTGAFSEWLPDYVTYTGVDWSNAMVERARRDHRAAHRSFWHYEPASTYDHVVVIGTFNLADNWSKQQTVTYMNRLLDKSKKTFVASVYMGDDPNCISYKAEDFYGCFPDVFTTFDEWRKNDMMIVVDKTS
jgi:cyclopropane fatty-acyl-phospholipid synthase-like methyltransferase